MWHPRRRLSRGVENFDSFGVTYESIVLFACIGIENLFVKVLRDNGATAERFSTTDFVKLNALMRLNEYEVVLARYPWLSPFSPFREWKLAEPTKSLKWFDAYNKLKHDKMASHNKATMRNAINACLGYWIVFRAVFGNAMDRRAFQSDDDDFYVKSFPQWGLHDYYLEPADGLWRPNSATL